MIPNRYPTLNFDLGETADMIRDTVQGFAQNEIAPLAAEIDRTDVFPRHLLPKMGELGLLGITVEEEWGGTGLGYLEHVVAMEEISRASASEIFGRRITDSVVAWVAVRGVRSSWAASAVNC